MMSTAEPTEADLPVAPCAGAVLRAARERLGWALPEVAAGLRIRLAYLEALEDGRLGSLPGNAYALAFVRTYAGTLGLDAQELVRRFKAEATAIDHRTELVFPVPMPERGLPAGTIMLLGLVLAIGAYAAWYRLSGEGRLPAEAVMPVPERLAVFAEPIVPPRNPIAIAPVPAAPLPTQADPPKAASADPVQVAATSPPSSLPSSLPAASPLSAAAAPAPVRANVPPSPAPSVPAPSVSEAEGRIVVHASADAWLLVKDRTGTVLLNHVLKAGENWPVPVRQDLVMTTGNAGGTDLLVDGAAAPPLGAPGAVRRDVPLDPDAIKSGKLATTVSPVAAARPRQ